MKVINEGVKEIINLLRAVLSLCILCLHSFLRAVPKGITCLLWWTLCTWSALLQKNKGWRIWPYGVWIQKIVFLLEFKFPPPPLMTRGMNSKTCIKAWIVIWSIPVPLSAFWVLALSVEQRIASATQITCSGQKQQWQQKAQVPSISKHLEACKWNKPHWHKLIWQ